MHMAVEGVTAGVIPRLVPMATVIAAVFLCFSRASAVQASSGTSRGINTEYVHQSCSSTLYPSLCYASIAPYANIVDRDPVRLAGVSSNVSLANVRCVASHVSSILHGPGTRKMDKRTVAALHDCKETLVTASSLIGKAAAELGRIPSARLMEVAWLVGNAQTWMSAALTNENTCVDDFASVASSAVKTAVIGRVQKAAQSTSNALAMVNRVVGPNN